MNPTIAYKDLDAYVKAQPQSDDNEHLTELGTQYFACSLPACMPLNDMLKLAGITIGPDGIDITHDKDMATVHTQVERLTFAQMLCGLVIQSELVMDNHDGPSMFQDNPGSRLWYHHFRLGGDGAVDDLGHGPFDLFTLCIEYLNETSFKAQETALKALKETTDGN